MSWFGFGGKKKKQKPEEVYKVKLDQLQKLGYEDRTKNLGLLKLYAGDVNNVIQDYQVQKPSSQSPEKPTPKQVPPKQDYQQPKPTPKQAPPKQESKPTPKQQPKPKQVPPKQEKQQPKPTTKPKQVPPKQQPPKQANTAPLKQEQKQAPKQDATPPKKQGLPPPSKEEPKSKSKSKPEPEPERERINLNPKMSDKPQPSFPKSKVYEGAKMAKPQFKTDVKKEEIPKNKNLELLNNLNGLISSDIRQILIGIGEPQIGEIILSNGMNGNQFYKYEIINPILKKFSLSFSDKNSYNYLVNQVELSYKKNGAIDIYNKQLSSEKKEEIKSEIIDNNESKSYELLKENIATLISSDVRLLLAPYNIELSERLYSHSINGNDLCKFDYESVCFISGIKSLTKERWNAIVSELKLPQTVPFNKQKWNNLKKEQEAIINKAKNMNKKVKNIMKNVNNKSKPQPQSKPKPKVESKEEKSPPRNTENKKLKKQQIRQLNTIIQMEKQTDKYLPQNLQKLKGRQLQTLTTLHDIASIIGLDYKIINDITQSAKKQSQKDLQNYLKYVNPDLINFKKTQIKQYKNITVQQIEKKQLQLLSNINKTRKRLQKIAAEKGVNLDELTGIKTKINATSKDVNVNELNTKMTNLFTTLASMALSVRETANQYNVKIDNTEIDTCLQQTYNDLETRQNNLIARIEYLNDQARMINPKAVQVNEQILHISGRSHTRSLSGPLHLAVPLSPGESPTPQDNFPDTSESKQESKKHSRSPSLSAGIVITSPDETQREANQVRERRKSLQNNSVLLKKVLHKYDKNKNGYLSKDEFINAVKEININLNQNDMNILNDVSDDKGVNVKKLINYVEEIHLTLKLKSCKQWNSFRMKIISAKQRK